MSARERIEAGVRERAQHDADFRSRLLADVAGTLNAEYGIQVPEEMTLRVVEEGADEVVLVVPPLRPVVAELGESELEPSAGGGGPQTVSGCWYSTEQCTDVSCFGEP